MEDDLGQRDLSFKPVANPNPRALTREQIEHYNEHGYIAPLDLFDAHEMAVHVAYFDQLLDKLKSLEDGRDQNAINCYHARCAGIWDLATHAKVLDYVQDIVGPNIVCWATHYFCKLGKDEKIVPYHQDASYWGVTPARTVTVWLAIDDADEENGAMKFLPGTHKRGHLEWKETLVPAALPQEIVGARDMGEPAYDVLKSGQCSLHADMLAHGSDANTSGRRRCGLTLRYFPPYVRRSCPYAIDTIIARGEDPDGYWLHVARPEEDDVTPYFSPRT